MEDFIYISRENGNVVDKNHPNAECYIRLAYAKVQLEDKDKAETLYKLNEELSRENDNLKEQIKVQKLIISRLEKGGRYHDDHSVFKGE